MKKVLLTGVTGFLGAHTAIRLLEKGYAVTGTFRSQNRANAIRKLIASHTDKTAYLTLEEADLNDPIVWKTLTKEVDFVQHIASPFPRNMPKHEEELIHPAKEGTLNVLRAAQGNGVKRVVVTSSIAAVVYGKSSDTLTKTMDEADWTDPSNRKDTTPYFRSKAIAEKAAWDFAFKHPEMELVTVLPGAILGPVLEADFGTSANIVIKLLDGSTPALPKIGFDIIDVRSVADLLILAMEKKQAAHNRYLASSGYRMFSEIAKVLKENFPDRKLPSWEMPNFLVRVFAKIDPSVGPILVDLGIKRKVNNQKAVRELGWKPKSVEEAIVSCAESVIEKGIVK
ncbi:aldehyde reductase [Echinicola soli]|uniref:Aldehyde reductase n=1 Tax=Echinicola soli TaxID=2591634 RepID=A0A514CK64_9BACT|nr:aldehyde reductase [Echinicola soli]QDH80235.1 aldehyde reductase [Echinicola soli]